MRRLAFTFLALCACDAVPAATAPDLASPENPIEGGAPRDLGAPPPDDAAPPADLAMGPCPTGMVHVESFCVDRWEAHVVEVLDGGATRPRSPFGPVDGVAVAARTEGGVAPQGYISQRQAAEACDRAGKRLCTATEFARTCRGPLDAGADYPYGGNTRQPGACNEGKGSSMVLFFGANAANWTYEKFNDPRLNQWDGGLAPTGAYPKCASPDGVMDCVGNLHEWGADAPDAKGRSRMRGGFYGDAEINGKGCRYLTSAHGPDYHDYSTGFRCCSDAL